MELYFELTAKPPRIVDEKGRVYTSFQAKALEAHVSPSIRSCASKVG